MDAALPDGSLITAKPVLELKRGEATAVHAASALLSTGVAARTGLVVWMIHAGLLC